MHIVRTLPYVTAPSNFCKMANLLKMCRLLGSNTYCKNFSVINIQSCWNQKVKHSFQVGVVLVWSYSALWIYFVSTTWSWWHSTWQPVKVYLMKYCGIWQIPVQSLAFLEKVVNSLAKNENSFWPRKNGAREGSLLQLSLRAPSSKKRFIRS